MKTIKILFICMFATLFVAAQNLPPFALEEVEVVPPKFTSEKISLINGDETVNTYISKHFVYPEIVGLVHEGTGVVQFVINPNGQLSNFKIVNSVSSAVDHEIIRVLANTKHMWIPGKTNGVPIAMEKEIAVQVKVGNSNSEAEDRDFTSIAQLHFTKGAEKLLIQQKPKKALHQFENAVRYKPYDRGLLTMLALCELELGHQESAHVYVDRIQRLGELKENSDLLTEGIKYLDSYEEFKQLLATR